MAAIIIGSALLSIVSIAGLLTVHFFTAKENIEEKTKPVDPTATKLPLNDNRPERNLSDKPEDVASESTTEATLPEEEIEGETEEEPFEREEPDISETMEDDNKENDQWLSTRERADALFEVCSIYDRLRETELPISLLIGPVEPGDIAQLTGDQLGEAILFKETMDTLSSTFGFTNPQMLFDHLLYGSISQNRDSRIKELLNSIAPRVLESLSIQNRETREVVYSSIFDELVAVGEFLPSERGDVIEKWHQEFIDIPPEDELDEDPTDDDSDEKIDSALESINRESANDLPSPTLKKIEKRSQKKGVDPRLKKVEKAQKLAKRHGVTLENLIHPEETSEEESDKLLDLIISARGDAGEEYSGYTNGSAADLLVESLLRVQLQNRTVALYKEHQHLSDYETIEQRVMDSLAQEFGPVVVNNHRSSIEQNLEWVANDGT